ncbi:MAG: ribosomal-protein-alanine N-acetyltransferase [Dehalococcoidia bacterium]|nr:ribosomal-protein-alanine N-acetyltransferase [Dehalococcoidia bacterium]MSQ17307.1 ribosomal-protein-alanine N-acetyltransferase [Dehalococcoidia bacterium]
MDVSLRRMRAEDIEQVVEIEREAFTPMWVGTPFKREMSNRYARYLMAFYEDGGPSGGLATPVAGLPIQRRYPGATLWRWLRGLFAGGDKNAAPLPEPTAISPAAGYVGVWFQGDDAHVTEIAVRGRLRGNGIGELLLIGSVRAAVEYGSSVVTLEVRVSNLIAIRLYEKYGFKQVGLRKAYYSDNREDAAIMTTSPIHSSEYQALFTQLQEAYQTRWRPIRIDI